MIRIDSSPPPAAVQEHDPAGEGAVLARGRFQALSRSDSAVTTGNLASQGAGPRLISPAVSAFAAGSTSPITLATTDYARDIPYDSYWENSGAVAGQVVFSTGNWGAAYSVDGGQTFKTVNPYAMFPDSKGQPIKGANGFCCDQVVEYVPQIDRFVWVLQSVDANTIGSENAYRIAVASPKQVSDSGATLWTTFDITPSKTGVPGSWFDFPTISAGDPMKGGSGQFIYLTFSKLDKFTAHDGTVKTKNDGGIIVRVPGSELTKPAGKPRSWEYFSEPYFFGHAAQDQGRIAYFGFEASQSQLAIYSWPTWSKAPVEKKVDIATIPQEGAAVSTADGVQFLGPSFKIFGATLAQGDLWLSWNAGRGYPEGVGAPIVFPFPHIEVARLDAHTLRLRGGRQKALFSNDYAMGQASLASNSHGDVGMTYEYGGAPLSLGLHPENFTDLGVAMLSGRPGYVSVSFGSAGAGGEHYMATRRAYPAQKCFASFGFVPERNAAGTGFKDRPSFTVFGRQDDSCKLFKPPPQPPIAITGDASEVGSDAATIHGTVDPNGSDTTGYLQYGTTASYSKQTSFRFLGNGTGSVPISAALIGLAPSTTYHFQIVGDNAAATAFGADRTFTTAPVPPPASGPAPDLLISSLTKGSFTVKNDGPAPAGPFEVRVTQENVSGFQSFSITGLGAGASESRDFFCNAGHVTATADPSNMVSESNETNNSAEINVTGCVG
jgi:CARDB